jgi:hypothetical protein
MKTTLVDALARTNQQQERQRAKAGGSWRLVAGKERINDHATVGDK